MPPILATILTLAIVIWYLRRDARQETTVTSAVWIPFAWMFLLGSRFVSQWFALWGIQVGGASLEEGSPLDAGVFLLLMILGLRVLGRRRVTFGTFAQFNPWLIAYFCYCFLAITWSDFPFVSFKRWIKILGHPIMVMVICTEPDPRRALVCLFRRGAWTLVPLSVLFVKYFPEWGRGFDQWSGMPFNRGVALDKNALGHDCMVIALFLLWQFLLLWKLPRGRERRIELFLCGGLLSWTFWLMHMAQSSTSLVSLLLAIGFLLLLGTRYVNWNNFGTGLIICSVAAFVLNLTFGITDSVIRFLGKDPTLTGRTEIWQEVLSVPFNRFFGTGFECFWLGSRYEIFAEQHWWVPNQAHNGYLETYINLGIPGLALMLILFVAAFWKTRAQLLQGHESARFLMALLLCIIIYNWTEAAFKGLSFVWFIFFFTLIDYPTLRSVGAVRETDYARDLPPLAPSRP